jgi:hypothetical protein
LPKSDLLAIPDFAAGAMENWGAVTYRESRLLIDPERTSLQTKTACTRTVKNFLFFSLFFLLSVDRFDLSRRCIVLKI